MSTWSEGGAPPRAARGTVLRGGAASVARPARMDAELRSSPFAPSYAVDSRLTDPHLQQVVHTATESAMELGRAEGHVAGYAAGLAVAAAEARVASDSQEQRFADAERQRQERLSTALEVLAGMARSLQQREAVSLADVENVVVDLAVEVARAVLDRELAVSAEPGREALVRALALAPQESAAVVRLHPSDAATLDGIDQLGAGRQITVVPDPSVERGGCIVDTAGRSIDAQVGTALARVAAVLR